MKRLSLAGFRDPVRRPRYIIWTGIAVMLVVFMIPLALTAASTYWFCSDVCHMVMDDAVAAYNHSAHAHISCLACHTHVGSDPLHFVIAKAEFGIDGVYKVATGTYPRPANAESKVAMETPRDQCTQCHAGYKKINPSPGMRIDHDAHKKAGVSCTVCHNRVAHQERPTLILAGNKRHVDFMTMEGCFRCHSQETNAEAPGTCAACHTPEFKLVPESHASKAFYTPYGDSTGHADLAREDLKRLDEAEAARTKGEPAENAHANEEGHLDIPSVETVSYCGQCHPQKFCNDCHGMEIPHPKAFGEDHAKQATSNSDACGKCHASSKADAAGGDFCSDCHHKVGDTTKAWFPQHPKYAGKNAEACMECHTTMYCETCHVSGKPKVAF